MSEFHLRLLGGLQAVLDEQDLTRPLSVKAQGLLCYLAVTGRPQSRLTIAGLFWSDKPEADALRSLRVELTKIRKYLADYLDITRQTITFSGGAACWIDVEAFEHHLKLAQSGDGAAARSHLREAAELYRGEFLAGYQAGDAYGFEEWLLAQRERYQTAALSALSQLVDLLLEQREYEAGIEVATQLLHIDPWREEAHRSLMWLYAQNGQRGAALRQFDLCQQILAAELGVEPEPETLALWRQIKEREGIADGSTQPLPLPSPQADDLVFQAPALVPFFTGRDEELALLRSKMTAVAEPALLCVVGMGGVGKSSLVTQLAHEARHDFADGVLWADGANNPAAIAERWTQAYGYDFTRIPNLADRFRAVRELLAQKQALIILDNAEVAARVKPLLPTAGQSVVIITTRTVDIATALNAELVNLAVLTLANGRSLFSSIVGQSRVQAEQAAADQICQQLQSLPLALAIAGQYLASHPRRRLADFAGRLAETTLLDVGDSEGLVRASFDISWSALDQNQQRVFALLGVFNGRSFTADAVAYIADLDSFLTQDYLDRLAARSLLTEQGSRHYQQHALLAQFAQEKAADPQAAARRMIAYFAQYARTYQTNYQQLGQEWENLDAVIEQTAVMAQWPQLFDLVETLHRPWFARGYFDKAKRAYAHVYTGAAALQDDLKMAESLFNQGQAILEQGDFEEAKTLFIKAIEIYQQHEMENKAADVQVELARIFIDQSRFPEAERVLSQCLPIKQSLGDELGLAKVRYRQARLDQRRSQFEPALQYALEALEIQERLGDVLGLLRTYDILFWLYKPLQQYEKAWSYAWKNLQIAQEIEDRGEIALALVRLAEAFRIQKEFDKALQFAQESLDLMERVGDLYSQARVLLRLCLIHLDAGVYDKAVEAGKRCLKVYEKSQDKLSVAFALGNLGLAYIGLGEDAKAERCLQESRQIGQALDNQRWLDYLDMREGEIRVALAEKREM